MHSQWLVSGHSLLPNNACSGTACFLAVPRVETEDPFSWDVAAVRRDRARLFCSVLQAPLTDPPPAEASVSHSANRFFEICCRDARLW